MQRASIIEAAHAHFDESVASLLNAQFVKAVLILVLRIRAMSSRAENVEPVGDRIDFG